MSDKSHFAVIVSLILTILFGVKAYVNAAGDEIPINSVRIVGGSPDVSGWSQTANITSLTLTGSGVRIDFDKLSGPGAWPAQCNIPGFECGPGSNGLQYTMWLFRNVNGTWYGSGFIQAIGDYNNPGGPLENTPCDWFYYVPEMNPGAPLHAGEKLGFMVTAGNQRRGNDTSVNERSNIKLFTVPGSLPASHCEGGGENPPPEPNPEPPSEPTPPPTPSETPPPPVETDTTSGWNGAMAFNPKNNTWFIVSQGVFEVPAKISINGRILDNEGVPQTPIFKIDQAQFFAGGPKVAYAPDADKFLVVWAQEGNLRGDTGDIYGRFYDTAGKPLGNSFNITPNDPMIPFLYPDSVLHYDSRNQRFVFAFENRVPGVNVYMKTVGVDGTLGPTVAVAEKPGDFLADPSLAVNEKDNEYCISYQNSAAGNWEAGGSNASRLAIKRVDAATLAVGPETFGSPDLFFNGSIVYNSREDKYFVVWTNYAISKALGKTLNTCNGTDSEDADDDLEIGALAHGVQASYNPKSNTYGIIAMDCCSFVNNYVLMDTARSVLEQGSVFLDSRNGRGGNYIPVIAANTNNGTYGVTSSVDYATTRFVPNMGAAVLIGRDYGPGQPFTPPGPRPTAPTEGLPTDLGGLIQQIFTWSLSLLGIAVFIMFFYAGFLWLTAAGNTAKVSEAKSRMNNAIFGAIILLSSYLILYTINPDFVRSSVNIPGLGN